MITLLPLSDDKFVFQAEFPAGVSEAILDGGFLASTG
jgi:hypothetical protein